MQTTLIETFILDSEVKSCFLVSNSETSTKSEHVVKLIKHNTNFMNLKIKGKKTGHEKFV